MNIRLMSSGSSRQKSALPACAVWFAFVATCTILVVRPAFAQTVQLQGTISPDALNLPTFGDADSTKTLPLEIWFKPRNHAKLNALLAAQQDPKSPQYHKWLTPQEYTKRFGPKDTDFNKVMHWLTAEGFQISGGSAAQGVIKFSGSILTIKQAFNTRIVKFSVDGSKFGNITEPELPAEYANIIGNITGLNNLMRVEPLHPAPLSAPTHGTAAPSSAIRDLGLRDEPLRLAYSPAAAAPEFSDPTLGKHFAPADAYTFYDETPLLNVGINGSTGADCIAIYAESDVFDDIVQQFISKFNYLPSVNLTRINVDGKTQGTYNAGETEALLDIQWVHAIAPGAPISLYLDPFPSDGVNRAVTDNKCGTINISFSICGAASSFFTKTLDPIFAKGASQGISIFVSTGDNGVDTCKTGTANVNEMAADPNVVAVGGTGFTPNFDANGNDIGFVAESAWNDSSGATGGGISAVFPKPLFQSVSGGPSGTMRTVPDVAMIASPNFPGVFIFDDGHCISGSGCGSDTPTLAILGGTSLAAPVWSGISKLIMQKNGGVRLGNLDTKIYNLASANQAGNGFRDVTTGNNTFNGVTGFNATIGYDLVTGWGTVDMNNFANAFVSSGATPTPTPTATATPTPSATATATRTPTPSASATRTATPTSTATASATPKVTPTPTHTPTPTATQTATPTVIATSTPTVTASATPTPTPTATPTGVPEPLNVKPSAENFGKVRVGRSKLKTLTLSNPAKTGPPITFGSPVAFSVPVTNPQEFGFPQSGATTCLAQLFPKKKCKLFVIFAPATPGQKSSAVTIFDNAGNRNQVIQLRGIGK